MDINKITLQYLINPNLYKKYVEKNKVEDIEYTFYKERIVELTEKLFDSKTNNIGLNDAFNNYVKEAITHLYTYDKTNTFQEYYHDLSLNTNIILDNSGIVFDISDNNNLIMKKKEPDKMDQYVKRISKTTKKNYPVQKEFNHLDNKYKHKNQKKS